MRRYCSTIWSNTRSARSPRIPETLRAELLRFRPTVTFYAASSQPGEVSFRMGLRTILTGDLKVRHAHMPGITAQLMQEGMRTDYRVVVPGDEPRSTTSRTWPR